MDEVTRLWQEFLDEAEGESPPEVRISFPRDRYLGGSVFDICWEFFLSVVAR